MALVIGRIASQQEVLARWGYSELISPRVSHFYHHHPATAAVAELARTDVPFDDIPAEHHAALAVAVSSIRSSYSIVVGQHRRFLLEAWSKEKVHDVFVDKMFNTPRRDLPMKFREFVRWNRQVRPDGSVHAPDPRNAADGIPPGTPPLTEEAPIVAGMAPGFLVDGYLRCLLFVRDAPSSSKLPVWVGLN